MSLQFLQGSNMVSVTSISSINTFNLQKEVYLSFFSTAEVSIPVRPTLGSCFFLCSPDALQIKKVSGTPLDTILGKNSCILLQGNTDTHLLNPQGEVRNYFLIRFEPAYFETHPDLNSLVEMVQKTHLLFQHNLVQEIIVMIQNIFTTMDKPEGYLVSLLNASLDSLIYFSCHLAKHEGQGFTASVLPRYITKKIRAYIQNHLSEDVSIEELAKEIGWSRFYMSRRFKEATGLSFDTYLRSMRIEEAKRLLTETNLNIAQIASKVGYDYPTNFTKAFTVEVGVTPMKFRRSTKR